MKGASPGFLIAVAAVLVVCFQNCSAFDFSDTSGPITRRSASSETSDGGSPYDGKTYVTLGVCSDGAKIASRIRLLTVDSFELLRENCQDIAPKRLTAAEVSFDPSKPEELTYSGQSFSLERAPIFVPALSPFYYQNSGALLTISKPVVYIVSGSVSAATVQQLKSSGHTVICEVIAGTVTDASPDRNRFAPSELGAAIGGDTHYWLDVRSANVRAVVAERFRSAAAKGCDGTMPTMVDSYLNNPGFPITPDDQAAFNIFLARVSHNYHMIAIHMNAYSLAEKVASVFDMALLNRCMKNGTCPFSEPWTSRGKPVFSVENTTFSQTVCDQARAISVSVTYLNYPFDGSRYETCN